MVETTMIDRVDGEGGGNGSERPRLQSRSCRVVSRVSLDGQGQVSNARPTEQAQKLCAIGVYSYVGWWRCKRHVMATDGLAVVHCWLMVGEPSDQKPTDGRTADRRSRRVRLRLSP
jgi:hypothetical protein